MEFKDWVDEAYLKGVHVISACRNSDFTQRERPAYFPTVVTVDKTKLSAPTNSSIGREVWWNLSPKVNIRICFGWTVKGKAVLEQVLRRRWLLPSWRDYCLSTPAFRLSRRRNYFASLPSPGLRIEAEKTSELDAFDFRQCVLGTLLQPTISAERRKMRRQIVDRRLDASIVVAPRP